MKVAATARPHGSHGHGAGPAGLRPIGAGSLPGGFGFPLPKL
jgi:hypothetical protein